jgi:hypothetical protein
MISFGRRLAARGTAWLVVLCSLLVMLCPSAAQDAALDALVRAYPDFLSGHDGKVLIWKDGTHMPVSDGRNDKGFDEKLRSPSIIDQLSVPYSKGPQSTSPQDDPGRFRNLAFFDKMYGDCARGEVEKRLAKVSWLPKAGGGTVRITTVNGVANRLRAISEELDHLAPELRKYAIPSAGTFNCRAVKDTGNRSAHAWGAAIDINTKFADYWLWAGSGDYRNRIPFDRDLRAPWFHLGRQVEALRHDALRVSAGAAVTRRDGGREPAGQSHPNRRSSRLISSMRARILGDNGTSRSSSYRQPALPK